MTSVDQMETEGRETRRHARNERRNDRSSREELGWKVTAVPGKG